MSIKHVLSQVLHFNQAGVSKHVYNARDRVDDEEEGLQSLMVLYTLVTMEAPALLLTLTTCINY